MKNLYITICLLLTVSVLQAQNASCDGTRYKQPTFANVKVTTVSYTKSLTHQNLPAGWADSVELKMDIYEPVGDNAEQRPVVVLAHGGSFVTGGKSDMKADCERFAKAGYVAASIQYRLFPVLALGFPDSIDIFDAVTKAIGDMKCAVRYFRQDAATTNLFRADPNHIFVGGYSAGAVAALHTAYIDTTDAIPPFIQSALTFNGGINGNSGSLQNRSYSSKVSAVYNRSGGLYRSHWIDEGQVPMVGIHGTNDATVYYNFGLAAGIAYLEGSGLIHPHAQSVNVDSYLETVLNGDHINMYTQAQHAAQVNNFFSTALAKFESITCNTSSVITPAYPAAPLVLVPNPAANIFAVQFESEFTDNLLQVVDFQGRIVCSAKNYVSGQPISVASLPTGIYAIILEEGRGKQVRVQKLEVVR